MDPSADAPQDPAPGKVPGQLRTRNLRLLREAVSETATSHDIHLRGEGIDGLTGVARLHRTNIVFVRYGGDVVVEAPPTGERFTLTLPLGPMAVGHHDLTGDDMRASGFVLAPDRRTLMGPDSWAGALVLATDITRLQEHLSAVLGGEVEGRLEFSTTAAGQALMAREHLDTATKLAWQAVGDRPPAAPSARLLEQNLLSAVLLALPHSHTDLLLASSHEVPRCHAEAAHDWMESHFAEAVSVVDVAKAVGLSVRQLQAVLSRRYHTTPMELLREIRLRKARELLAEPENGIPTVAAVAHRCGFSHLGRFSAAYRQRYGEKPSTTLRRIYGPS